MNWIFCRNGGGAFLIPYLLAAIFIGLPVFFAELIIGQYSGLGPTKAFAYLAPFFRGNLTAKCCTIWLNFSNFYIYRTWLQLNSSNVTSTHLLLCRLGLGLLLLLQLILP